jgi:NAD(P)-dependent dehydrogenase (short-subunit alcohol dehydrogenase family)
MSTVVITGCNRGTGAGIARVLDRAGYLVLGWNRTPAAVGACFSEILCDVRNPTDVDRAAAQLPDDLVAVVANAAVRRFSEVETLSLEDWRASVETNLDGVFYLARACVPHLKRNRGYFLVIGSHAEKYPFEGGAAYCATKLAVRGLVDCLIAETRQQGVRASYLSLGAIKNREHGPPAEDPPGARPRRAERAQGQPGANDAEEAWKLLPEDIGELVLALLRLPPNMLVNYLDARPLMPPANASAGISRLQGV